MIHHRLRRLAAGIFALAMAWAPVIAAAQGVTVQQLPAASSPLSSTNVFWCGQGTHTYNCTLDQINSYILGKQNTWTGGKQYFPTSTAGYASVNFPQGSTPTSPIVGDLWCTSVSCYLQAASGQINLGSSGSTVVAGTGISVSVAGSAYTVGLATGAALANLVNGSVSNAKLATVGANTFKGNVTGSTAAITDNALPSCAATGNNHLNYTLGTGFSCGTNISPGGVTSFTAGTTGLTPNSATTGAVTLAGTLAIANGGTGATTAAAALANLGASESLISTSTFSSSGGPVMFLTGSCNTYRIKFTYQPSTTSFLQIQFSYDGGSTWKTGSSDYIYAFQGSSGPGTGTAAAYVLGSASVNPGGFQQNVSSVEIFNPYTAGVITTVMVSAATAGTSSAGGVLNIAGYTANIYGVPNAVRIVPTAGTISGAESVYCVAGL